MRWRCFLINFREVMPSLLSPPFVPSSFWVVLLDLILLLSAAALPPPSLGWCCLPPLPPLSGAAFSFLPCGWCCCPAPCSFLFGEWCCLPPFSFSVLLLFSPLSFLGGAAILLSTSERGCFLRPPCGLCCFPNLLSGGASFSASFAVLLGLLLLLSVALPSSTTFWVVLPLTFLWNEMK